MTTTADAGIAITCPAWCIVPTSEHLADLADWGGAALHFGDHEFVNDDVVVRLAAAHLPDGTPADPTPTSAGNVQIMLMAGELTYDDAEAFAHRLLAMAKDGRG